jgi:hypothetical protein
MACTINKTNVGGWLEVRLTTAGFLYGTQYDLKPKTQAAGNKGKNKTRITCTMMQD